jgi:hypothetical protein
MRGKFRQLGEGGKMMKKCIFSSCTLFLVLGFAATLTNASAQATPGIEGVWFAHITPVDCQTGAVIPNAPSFRGLNMFSHDGSMTNDAAFPGPTLLRSSGLGTWQHTQAQTYTLAFRFFRYNADGSFAAMRRVTQTLVVNGDQYTSVDHFQDFDLNNNPLPATGCNIESAIRVQ